MSVTVPENVPQKRYGLFILAILLLLSAGAAFYVESESFTIRSLAAVALVASMYLVRISHVHARSTSVASSRRVDFTASERPQPMIWFVGIALFALAGVSYLLILDGGHTAWPVYLFAGVAVACACVWGYIITKLVWRGR